MSKNNNSVLDCIFVNSLKRSHESNAANIITGDITVNDYRKIEMSLDFIKKQPLLRRDGVMLCNVHGNILHREMIKSFHHACFPFFERSENIPFLDRKTLENIGNKISFVIEHISKRSRFISDSFGGVTIVVKPSDLCKAICDCVFFGMKWSNEEATPIIRNLLNSQCLGNVSLYKTDTLIGMIKSGKLKDQPFSSKYRKNDCWLKYTRYIKGRNTNTYNENGRYSKAKKYAESRNPEEDAIISELINFLGIKKIEDRIYLKKEPSILEFARYSREHGDYIPYHFIPFTLRILIEDLCDSLTEMSIARGLLGLYFPCAMSDKKKMEKILLRSLYVKNIKNKKPLGIKNNHRNEYMMTGNRILLECIPEEHKNDFRFCSTREFYYSLFRSHKKSLNCEHNRINK